MAITIDEFEVSAAAEEAPATAAPPQRAESTDPLTALRQLQQQLAALQDQSARLLAD